MAQQQPQRSNQNQTGSKPLQHEAGKTEQRDQRKASSDERFDDKKSQNQSEKGRMTDQAERSPAKGEESDEA